MRKSLANLRVQAGDLLRAGPWNEAGRIMRSLQLIAGHGIRLRQTANGTIINADVPRNVFIGHFKCQLQGEEAISVTPGRINGLPATIKDVPLEGVPEEDTPPPLLELDEILLDEEGKGYVAVEVKCSEEGLWAVEKAEVVQVAYLHSDDGKEPPQADPRTLTAGGMPNLPGYRARAPLAMLRRRAAGNLELFQIAYHDMGHLVKLTGTDRTIDKARHFFYAV